jgi:hypothetical protein
VERNIHITALQGRQDDMKKAVRGYRRAVMNATSHNPLLQFTVQLKWKCVIHCFNRVTSWEAARELDVYVGAIRAVSRWWIL